MSTRAFLPTLLAVLVVASAACEDSTGANASGFQVSGSSTGDNIPERARALVVWYRLQDDSLFKLGDAEAVQGRFTIDFPDAPPPGALNPTGSDAAFGIGFVVLVSSDLAVNDGAFSGPEMQRLEASYLGVSTQHVITWRKGQVPCSGDPQCTLWINRMPEGFSCGRCVPARPGEGFDSFEKVDCREMKIETAKDRNTLRVCNWS